MTKIFPTDFRKILKYYISFKSVGAEFFQADGRRDGRKDRYETNIRFFFAVLQTRPENQRILRKEEVLFQECSCPLDTVFPVKTLLSIPWSPP